MGDLIGKFCGWQKIESADMGISIHYGTSSLLYSAHLMSYFSRYFWTMQDIHVIRMIEVGRSFNLLVSKSR